MRDRITEIKAHQVKEKALILKEVNSRNMDDGKYTNVKLPQDSTFLAFL
jgi:hypothetical protein